MRRTIIALAMGAALLPTVAASSDLLIDLRVETTESAVDREQALRHYARTGQRDRLAREAERLRGQDPSWRPPSDLFHQVDHDVDATPIWKALEAKDPVLARARLTDLRERHPGKTIDPKAIQALEAAEKESAFANAALSGDHRTVVTAAREAGYLEGCDRIDYRWQAADSLVKGGDKAGARDMQRSTLAECASLEHRIATLEKIHASHGLTAMREEAKTLKANPSVSASDRAAIDQLLGRYATTGSSLAGRVSAAEAPLPRSVILEFESEIERDKSRANANILAWYHYRLGDLDAAERWFSRSKGWRDNANAIEGLARVEISRGNPAGAERISRPWAGQWDDVRSAHREALLAGLAAGTLDQAGLDTARKMAETDEEVRLALGWHLLDDRRYAAAEDVFYRSVQLNPTPDTVEGLAVAYERLGERRELERLYDRYGHRGEDYASRLDPLIGPAGGALDEAMAAYEAKDYQGCLDHLYRAMNSGAGDISSAWALSGWCHKEQGDYARADEHFVTAITKAESDADRKDAALGRVLIEAERGSVDEAIRMARHHGVEERHIEDLRTRKQVEVAVTAYNDKDYVQAYAELSKAPSTRETDLMKAWSMFHIGKRKEAHELFQRLDQTESTPDTREGLKITRNSIFR